MFKSCTNNHHTALQLYDLGYCVIPLKPESKIPAVKWAAYQVERPSRLEVDEWFTRWPYYEIGIITGPVSGVMVLDYDTEPFPDNDHHYVETRRGRHYYYRYFEGDLHGLQVKPGIDIPRLAKFYSTPVVNDCRIPLQPSVKPSDIVPDQPWTDNSPPEFELIEQCEFIRWFREKRDDQTWDGRYPLARAYAANVLRCRNPDTNLGAGYRHAESIIASCDRPITCETIGAHWRCPYMNDYGLCTKAPGVRSPYGLAKRSQ